MVRYANSNIRCLRTVLERTYLQCICHVVRSYISPKCSSLYFWIFSVLILFGHWIGREVVLVWSSAIFEDSSEEPLFALGFRFDEIPWSSSRESWFIRGPSGWNADVGIDFVWAMYQWRACGCAGIRGYLFERRSLLVGKREKYSLLDSWWLAWKESFFEFRAPVPSRDTAFHTESNATSALQHHVSFIDIFQKTHASTALRPANYYSYLYSVTSAWTTRSCYYFFNIINYYTS